MLSQISFFFVFFLFFFKSVSLNFHLSDYFYVIRHSSFTFRFSDWWTTVFFFERHRIS